jgi:hypothetical protein
VVFDKESHTYHLDGVCLGGVTAIVKWMYPDTYKDIPQEVLMRAAEYGTMVHSMCELADRFSIVESDIVKDYMKMKQELGLRTVENEYLVSDEEAIASSIDVVLQDVDVKDEDVFTLADIKTTSKIHFENVRLQLSIYAYLFELNNPDKKAGKLYVFWLPKAKYGKAKAYELQRISSGLCAKIIEAYLNKEEPLLFPDMIEVELGGPAAEPKETSGDLLTDEEQEELVRIAKALDDLKRREKELKETIMKRMQSQDCKKWSSDLLSITLKAASKRVTIDSSKLKDSYPDIYDECKKETSVGESVMIKVL